MNSCPSLQVYRFQPACVLVAKGPDAFGFLQGQFSNDLRLLESSPAVYGLWLSHKGRVLADSSVVRAGADAYWIVSSHSPSTVVLDHLQNHLVADEVELEEHTGRFSGAAVVGAGSGSRVATDHPPGSILVPGRRCPGEHWEVLHPSGGTPYADLAPLTEEQMEAARIGAGIAAIPADIGPLDLPNEGGLETGAVAYSKGCYLGQEIMARLRSKGRVRRRLVRVAGTGPRPVTPAVLWSSGQRAGELRSAVSRGDGFLGIAMLGTAFSDAGCSLALDVSGPPAVVVAAR